MRLARPVHPGCCTSRTIIVLILWKRAWEVVLGPAIVEMVVLGLAVVEMVALER